MPTTTPEKKASASRKKAGTKSPSKTTPKRAVAKKRLAKTASRATAKKATRTRASKAKATSSSSASKARASHATKGAALKKLAHTSRARAVDSSKKMVAEDSECFWVNNGPVVSTLAELARTMHEISDDQFWHHVRPDQNDFARWVEDVFGERGLARKIERTKSRTGTYRVVVAHVSLGS